MKSRVSLSSLILLIALSAPLQAAFEGYLKFDGLKGDAQSSTHRDWIQIESFSWGATPSANTVQGNFIGTDAMGCSGSDHTLNFTRRPSSVSPELMRLCNSRKPLSSVTVDVNGERHNFQNVSFKSCPADGAPMESFSLNFTRCATHASVGTPMIKKATDLKIKEASNATLLIPGKAPEGLLLSELKINGPNAAILIGLLRPSDSKATRGGIILQNSARSGQRIPTLVIETRAGKWTFTDVMISSYHPGGANVPTDQVSLNFTKVEGPPSGFQDLALKIVPPPVAN